MLLAAVESGLAGIMMGPIYEEPGTHGLGAGDQGTEGDTTCRNRVSPAAC
jgi:hypothetical protein